MIDERRCTVLLRPEHFSTNPPGAEHKHSDRRIRTRIRQTHPDEKETVA